MKYVVIIIGLLILSSCNESLELKEDSTSENIASKSDEKVIILSGDQWPNKCSKKAVKISSSRAEFDDCYNGKFKTDKSTPLSDTDFFHALYNISGEDWQVIKVAIDSIDYCDAAIAFSVEIISEGKKETTSLPRMSNCYPESCKELMNKIEDVFENWSLD